MESGLFDEIRRACGEVAGQAAHVRVDAAGAIALADALTDVLFLTDEEHGADLRLADPADTVAFVLLWDAVNFGSGWFPVVRKRPGLSGARSLFACLRDHVDAHGVPSAAWLATVDAAVVAEIFDQDASGPAADLIALYTTAWRDLGTVVDRRFGGSFTALVDATDRSAERLVGLLASMPLFADVATYRGRRVPLYKRAQITVSDLDAALRGHGLGRFDDLERLTMFPDNLVPHVLRVEGVLHYEAALAARIDAGDLLVAGSAEEVEIRACGLHAVELVTTALRERGRADARSADVDHLLWLRGQAPRYKALPRHRCRCPFY